jgi:hypothetical protein
MHTGHAEQHLEHRPGVRGGLARACALLAFLAAPAQALEAPAGERSAGGHRWETPMWISAPATSVLAVAGIAGLAAHLFRRRRSDKRSPPSHKMDEDWDQRIAMWERRLRGDRPNTPDRDGRRRSADDDPPDH